MGYFGQDRYACDRIATKRWTDRLIMVTANSKAHLTSGCDDLELIVCYPVFDTKRALYIV